MKKKEEKVENEPNVKFVGMKTVHGEQVKKEVPPFVMVGRTKIVLPVVEHGESFFSPHASLLTGSSRDFESCLASK